MDPILFIPLLLIVIGIIVIICITVGKKHDDASKYTTYHTEPKKPPTSTPVVAKQMPEVAQVTIYKYQTNKKTQLCSMCDGENDSSATHCRICGKSLN